MSKSRHNKYIDTIDECLTNGVKNGIFQISIEDESLNGRHITIEGKKVINFGSCSYLGLEMDSRIREGSKKAIDMYGTQFSASRLFASCGLYKTAEDLLSQIFFNKHVIISPTTTLAHVASIPILVEDNDLIVLDHQVHGSVHLAVQLPKARGVQVEMIRHNNLEELEHILIENRTKYNKIWYFIDSLYSMYGDYAPIKELEALLNKYDNFHLYVDDAHGMSWIGKNGTGYVLSQIEFHPKLVIATSFAKAFATGGGLLVFHDAEIKRKILTCGSSFTFSGPLQPSQLGAIIESAKIHLSDEINTLQSQLNQRTRFALNLIKEYQLPLMAPTESPIFYLPLGLPRVGYNMVKRLLKEGFYTNIGIFPGVPVKCTGLRLAINNNQTIEDIQNVIDAFQYHFPKVLEEEGQTIEDINTNFKMKFEETEKRYQIKKHKSELDNLIIQHETTINKIDKTLWDNLLGENGSFDWEGCRFLEETFCENPEPENNWNFHYLIIRDETNKPILATFFSELLCKDDMLSQASVSQQIEELRKTDKYYLTSKIITMGSLLSEGEHLYIDRKSPHWKNAMLEMIRIMTIEKEKCGASAIHLRDFDTKDPEMRDFLIKEGFIKLEMPDIHVIDNLTWKTDEEFVLTLSPKSRNHVRKYAVRTEKNFVIKHYNKDSKITDEKIQDWYNLYLNVKKQSLHLNTFDLPMKLFKNINKYKGWETLEINFNDELDLKNGNNKKPVSMVFCYSSCKNNFTPMIIGMNYLYLKDYYIYRQSLYQMVKRAKALNSKLIYYGMEATVEKQKFGAHVLSTSMYLQAEDNFNMELISLLKNQNHYATN